MLFKLINGTQAMRNIWSRGQQVMVNPGESKTVDLHENNAVFLRRLQKRGEKLEIEALSGEGEKVLEQADQPPPPRTSIRGLGPDRKMTGQIRDDIEEARLRELSKRPDQGMRSQPSEQAQSQEQPRQEQPRDQEPHADPYERRGAHQEGHQSRTRIPRER